MLGYTHFACRVLKTIYSHYQYFDKWISDEALGLQTAFPNSCSSSAAPDAIS